MNGVPSIVKEDNYGRLWWMQDTNSPQVGYFCKMSNPYLSTMSPIGSVISSLHCKMLTNSLLEDGDTTTKVTSGRGCLTIACWSEDDNLQSMVEKVSQSFADPKVWSDSKREVFENIKHKWLQSLISPGNPKTLALERVRELIQEKYWPDTQIIDILEWLEFEEARRLVRRRLKQCSITTFVYGKITRKFVLELDLRMKEKLFVGWNFEQTLPARTVHYGAMGKPHIYQCLLPEKTANCIMNAYPLFPALSKESAKAQLCIDIMSSHLLSSVPSGDMIQLQLENIQGLLVYCVTVESWDSPEKMNSWVETLHKELLYKLNGMAASTFYERVQSLSAGIPKTPKKIADQFWSWIVNEQYAFTREKEIAEEVSRLELADVLQFYRDYIHPQGSKRAKLGAWVYCNCAKPIILPRSENIHVSRESIIRLKDSLPLNPSYLQRSVEAHRRSENPSKL